MTVGQRSKLPSSGYPHMAVFDSERPVDDQILMDFDGLKVLTGAGGGRRIGKPHKGQVNGIGPIPADGSQRRAGGRMSKTTGGYRPHGPRTPAGCQTAIMSVAAALPYDGKPPSARFWHPSGMPRGLGCPIRRSALRLTAGYPLRPLRGPMLSVRRLTG